MARKTDSKASAPSQAAKGRTKLRKATRPSRAEAELGGRAVVEGRGPLWRFSDANDSSFVMPDAQRMPHLYFPLCNLHGMKCSVTPELKGDICADFQHYLTIPIVTEDIHRVRNSRNVWVNVPGKTPWSATGMSVWARGDLWSKREEETRIEAGLGWFTLIRTNRALRLESRITLFVPDAPDRVELMQVELRNIGRKPVDFSVTTALPIFGRTADHLRDHRQVTTICNRVWTERHGVVVKPTLHHEERGHVHNPTHYAVLGYGAKGQAPRRIWANMQHFIGDGGTLENPEAVVRELPPPRNKPVELNGREAIGAMRFAPVKLAPGKSVSYVLLHGITDDAAEMNTWGERYGSAALASSALEKTKEAWQRHGNEIRFSTPERDMNNWARWVSVQPIYRKVFGNSYLPDYGYGRGGRGWRDLWQDLLALFLIDPADSRQEMVNNFRGVRVDGTNATIVGTRPGEFLADRNNIPRVWCDHGAWPFLVTRFYLDQSGDHDLLFTELPYWRDNWVMRCKQRDSRPPSDNLQKTADGKTYEGSVLEHLLLENLAGFYNVGEHNNILLEGADWNDCYDGARHRGESVCFSNLYAWNLQELAALLRHLRDKKGLRTIPLLQEMQSLLDRLPGGEAVDYDSPSARQERLRQYMASVADTVSGIRADIDTEALAADLQFKAEAMMRQIRENEWVTTEEGESFFNGHYDDDARPVHGDHPLGVRMDLTSQVMPTMCDVATEDQIARMYAATQRYLRDPRTKGLRLTTDYNEVKLNFGRATGFAYGHKEHGSMWNQQNAMFLYGLYKRGFAREGHAVFRAIYEQCMNTRVSKIFPNMPSFFTILGYGSYNYLTGSAAWLLTAIVTRMYGIRGEHGDLVIEPKLVRSQFGSDGLAGLELTFAGRRLHCVFSNEKRTDYGSYRVAAVHVNGKPLPESLQEGPTKVRLPRAEFLERCDQELNRVDVVLAKG